MTGKLGLPCSILSRKKRRTILQATLDLSPPSVISVMSDITCLAPPERQHLRTTWGDEAHTPASRLKMLPLYLGGPRVEATIVR